MAWVCFVNCGDIIWNVSKNIHRQDNERNCRLDRRCGELSKGKKLSLEQAVNLYGFETSRLPQFVYSPFAETRKSS
jgi:hypothetical protein